MISEPFIQNLRVGAVIQANTPSIPCVILPCHNPHEATVVLEALKDFIRQLKQHIDEVEDRN